METAEQQARNSQGRSKGPREQEAPPGRDVRTTLPVPEVVFLLDDDGCIANWTGPHPGPRLGELTFERGRTVHDALHPGCDRSDCRLTESFAEAWRTHLSGLPVEWLFVSHTLEGVLKLRLQPVGYMCGALYGEAVACYEHNSVLFMHDVTAGYRAAEQDENPRWRAVKGLPQHDFLSRRLLPVGSPVLEPAPDARLTSLTARLLVAQEAEKKRLAAELHDGLGQTLSLIRFEIEGCIDQQADPDRSLRALERAGDYVRRSQEELRRIMANLGPVSLKKYGLAGSLDLLCQELRVACRGIRVRCMLEGPDHTVPARLAVAVYRIAQEALNNVANHAAATSVTVCFGVRPNSVDLTIADDGVGLPGNGKAGAGLGLTTMRERAESLGGGFRLVSAPGEGCEIRVRWTAEAVDSLR